MSWSVWAPRHEAGAVSVRFFFLTSLFSFDVDDVILVFFSSETIRFHISRAQRFALVWLVVEPN
jgi:hypothetical protein